MDSVLPEFKQEIDEHITMLQIAYQCPIATPWQDAPPHEASRHLQRELLTTHLAALAARELSKRPEITVDKAVSTAHDTVSAHWPRGFDDRGVSGKARRLLLRAQARAVTPPANVPAQAVVAINAVDRRWRAVSAALEGFASQLESIQATHGEGMALSASKARERQGEIDRAGYAETRALFLEHYAPGRTQLALDDDDLRALLLARDGNAPSLFSPWRAFSMLHAQFAATARDRLLQQVADALVKALCLRAEEEPKIVGGHVVVSRSAWIDAFDKAHLGRTRYTYSCREDIQSALRAIADVWPHVQPESSPGAIDNEMKQALATLEAADWCPTRALRPRLMGIELRCFQGKVEYWLPEAIASQINVFVTEHSTAFKAQSENA